ncbi:MAG: hypothetical protein CMJ58_16490 [Planctomycetaceae bacterium]|nr:hypothetical protein [Planctomycetaceae bacterium]
MVTILSTCAACCGPATAQIPLAVFKIDADQFAGHPNGDYVYASEDWSDKVYRVNLNTLQVDASFYAGDGPYGMALSEDGSRLYVANKRTPTISVIDTATNQLVDQIDLPVGAYDVEMASGGYLYATPWRNDLSGLMQIDTATAQFVDSVRVLSSGSPTEALLQISPDRQTLYVAETKHSGGGLFAFDVSEPIPRQWWSNRSSFPLGTSAFDLGGPGRDLAVSGDGNSIAYLTGAGNGINGARYDIAILDSRDFSVIADYEVGRFPTEAAFSPDGAVLYAVHEVQGIDVIVVDREKYEAAPTWMRYSLISTPRAIGNTEPVRKGVHELFIDRTGSRLIASIEGEVRIFDTGRRVIPEPSSWCLLGLGAFAMQSGFLGIRVSRRRRARSRAHLRHNGC